MRIGIPAETRPGETRVAATPETVKKLAVKHSIIVQAGAGLAASVTDEAYLAAGAQIGTAAEAFGAEVVLKVRAPDAAERGLMRAGTVLIGMLNPFDADNNAAMAAAGLQAFALEAVP
ncbi:MAG: NAD(P)(+) transhydrogenase (Re/Si-specific) subunit alpha, partial [Burkholderiaceae bacterium]|nr:NAD(P)(+) transhydrogenase (Re/Si-specific) subunit alpha [Burkholderiaceae bacterium]